MYALIIIIFMGGKVTTTQVDGFASYALCANAGDEIKANIEHMPTHDVARVSYTCVMKKH